MHNNRRRQLILVKHSLPEIVPDVPSREWVLSAEGRQRCLPLAQELARYGAGYIAASNELKAIETARLLSSALGLPFEIGENLHEHRREHAAFLGQEEFERTMQAFFEHPDELIYGEETANEARQRFTAAVEHVIRVQQQETLIIVAHGTVIALFITQYNECPSFQLWRALGLPSFRVFSLPDYILF